MNARIDSKEEPKGEILPGAIILCDLDGTLVDTDYANYMAYRSAFLQVVSANNDLEFTPGDRLNRESLKKRIPSLTDAQIENIISKKTNHFVEYLPDTKVNEDLVGFLNGYQKTHAVVLVSTCRESRAIETLKFHGLLGLFSRLICREHLPVPGMQNKYASALLLLAVEADSVFICECEAEDVEKAVLAGIPRTHIINVQWRGKENIR